MDSSFGDTYSRDNGGEPLSASHLSHYDIPLSSSRGASNIRGGNYAFSDDLYHTYASAAPSHSPALHDEGASPSPVDSSLYAPAQQRSPKGLSSRVQVVTRLRPVAAAQTLSAPCVEVHDDLRTVTICKEVGRSRAEGYPAYPFTFDRVYDPSVSQKAFYTKCVRPLVSSALLEGVDSAIVALGQSKSGKTFALEGVPEHEKRGLIPRALEDIFTYIRDQAGAYRIAVKASYAMIHSESISDLLVPSNTNLKVLEPEGASAHGTAISGLSEHQLATPYEILDLLKRGRATRSAKDLTNRSHAVMIVTVEQHPAARPVPGRPQLPSRSARMFFVDTAAYERSREVGQSGLSASRLDEAQKVAKSFNALATVLAFLSRRGNQGHVPYRDSRLTHVLKDCINESAFCLLIACLNPTTDCYAETLAAAKFASRLYQSINSSSPLPGLLPSPVSSSSSAPLQAAPSVSSSMSSKPVDVSSSYSQYQFSSAIPSSSAASASASASRVSSNTFSAMDAQDEEELANRRKIRELQATVEKLSSEQDRLIADLQDARAVADESRLRAANETAESRRLEEEINSLRRQIGDVTSQLTLRTDERDQLQRQVLTRDSQFGREREAVEQMRDELILTKTELLKSKETRDTMRRELDETRSQLIAESQRRQALEVEVNHFRSEFARSEEERKEARLQCMELSKKLSVVTEHNNELRNVLSSCRQENERFFSDREHLESDVVSSREKVAALVRENERLTRELSAVYSSSKQHQQQHSSRHQSPAVSSSPALSNNSHSHNGNADAHNDSRFSLHGEVEQLEAAEKSRRDSALASIIASDSNASSPLPNGGGSSALAASSVTLEEVSSLRAKLQYVAEERDAVRAALAECRRELGRIEEERDSIARDLHSRNEWASASSGPGGSSASRSHSPNRMSQARVQQLVRERERLERDLAHRVQQVRDANEEIQSLKIRMADLRLELHTAREHRDKAHRDLHQQQQELITSAHQIDEFKEELKERDLLRAINDDLRRQTEQQSRQLEEAEEHGRARASLETAVRELQALARQLREENETARRNADHVERELKSTMSLYDATRHEAQQAREACRQLEEELDHVRSDLDSTRQDLQQGRMDGNNLKQQLDSTVDRLRMSNADCDALRTRLAQEQEALSMESRQRSSASEEAAELRIRNSQLMADKFSLESDLSRHQRQLEQTTSEREMWKSESLERGGEILEILAAVGVVEEYLTRSNSSSSSSSSSSSADSNILSSPSAPSSASASPFSSSLDLLRSPFKSPSKPRTQQQQQEDLTPLATAIAAARSMWTDFVGQWESAGERYEELRDALDRFTSRYNASNDSPSGEDGNSPSIVLGSVRADRPTARLSTMHQALSHIFERLRTAQSQVALLQRRLASCTEERDTLTRSLSDRESRIQALEEQVSALQTENGGLVSELARTRDERENARREVISKDSTLQRESYEMETLRYELEQAREELQRGKTTREQLRQQVLELNSQYSQERDERTESSSQLSACRRSLETVERERDALRKELKTAQSDLTKTHEEIEEARLLIARSSQDSKSLNEDRLNTQRRLAAAEKSIEALEKDLKDSEAALREARADIQRNKFEVSRMSDKSRDESQRCAQLEDERKSLLLQNAELKMELHRTREDVARLRKESENNIVESSRQADRTHRELDHVKEELKMTQELLSRAQGDRDAIQQRAEALETQYRVSSSDLSSTVTRVSELESEIKQLLLERDALRKQVRVREAALSESENASSHSQAESRDLSKALETLRGELVESQATVVQRNAERERLLQDLMRRENELKRIQSVREDHHGRTIELEGEIRRLNEDRRRLREEIALRDGEIAVLEEDRKRLQVRAVEAEREVDRHRTVSRRM